MIKEPIVQEKNNLYCEHLSQESKAVYIYAWAGDNTRICLCRLCSSMMLGTIISGRIEDIAAGTRLRDIDRRKMEMSNMDFSKKKGDEVK